MKKDNWIPMGEQQPDAYISMDVLAYVPNMPENSKIMSCMCIVQGKEKADFLLYGILVNHMKQHTGSRCLIHHVDNMKMPYLYIRIPTVLLPYVQ